MKNAMTKLLRVTGFTVACVSFSALANAGVMVTEKDEDVRTQTLFQNNVVYQIQDGQLIAKFDLANKQCSLYMPHINIVGEGDCEALFGSLKRFQNKAMDQVKAMREAMMKNMTPEQQKMFQQANMTEEEKVRLVKASTATIQGYPAQRYDMLQNGELIHSVWVSKKLRDQILKEVDNEKVKKFQAEIGNDDNGDDEFADQIDKYVSQLEENAETMRVAKPDWDAGSGKIKTVREIVGVEVKNFNTSQFQFPKGLRKVEAAQIGDELAKQMRAFSQ